MKNFKMVVAGFALSFVVAGCSKGGLGTLKKLKDEACVCTNKACAEAVNKKMDAAIEEIAKSGEPSEADGKEIMKLMTAAGACLAPLM